MWTRASHLSLPAPTARQGWEGRVEGEIEMEEEGEGEGLAAVGGAGVEGVPPDLLSSSSPAQSCRQPTTRCIVCAYYTSRNFHGVFM